MNKGDVIDVDKFGSDFSNKLKASPFILALAIVLGILIFFRPFVIVGAGKRVVIFNQLTGVERRSLGEGFHFLVPYLQNPMIYDVQTLSYTMASRLDEGQYKGDDAIECLTADGQKVKLDLSVIYNLIPEEVWQLHQQVGSGYLDKVIRPTVRTIARNTIANYSVIELYSGKRELLQGEIQRKVQDELKKYHIAASESLIRNISFSDEFSKAIEQKQVAMQEAERMRYILEKEKREKERKIIEAEGEAIAISKKGSALKNNPQLIQYEYVAKLTPGINTIITDQNSIMNFPSELFQKKGN